MNKLVLKFNSGGQGPKGNVLLLQEFLKSKGINPGKLDNIWGENTERAVKEAVNKGLLSPESLKSRAIVAPTVEQNINTVQNMYTKSSDLDTNPTFKNYRKTKKIVDEAPAKAEQARKAEEQKNAKLIKRKGVVRANAEKDTKAMQEALLAKGYDLGKWGADGKWGNATQAALDKAAADGYIYEKGKLVKKPEEKQSTSTTQYTTHPMFGVSFPSAETMSNAVDAVSNFTGDVINYMGRKTPIVKYFVHNPYYGSEEDARKLGYKHYTTNGFTRHPVNYSVPNEDQLSNKDRAATQLGLYGITSEQTRDKSPISTIVYQYAPGYGYNPLKLVENVVTGNPLRRNGKRTGNDASTPYTNTLMQYISESSYAPESLKSAAKKSLNHGVNDSNTRFDLINTYFGYPQLYNTLQISNEESLPGGNAPVQGYFYKFTNDNTSISKGRNTKRNTSVHTKGENMNTYTVGNDNGKGWYYDLWDINPVTHIPGFEEEKNLDFLGTPFELHNKR